MKRILLGMVLLIAIAGISSAISGGPGVKIVKDFQFYDQASGQYLNVNAQPNVMLSARASATDFQVYDRISKRWFNVTDDDLTNANAWVDETGGVPLISSPYSGKAYAIQIAITADEDYLECIPLTGMVAIEPLGYVELPSGTGNRFWSTAYGPSAGADGLDEYAYMYVYGWNPEILWQNMGEI